MMVVEGTNCIVLHHTVHLGKVFFWLIKLVEDIVDKDDIHAVGGKNSISSG